MKIVCLGDSLTQGYGVDYKENWVELLNNSTGIEFINKGINGDTTSGMLSRFYRDVVDENARYTIIMGGTNDFICGNTLGAVKSNIMAMIHQAYYNKIVPIIGIGIKVDIYNFRQDWVELTDVEQLNYLMMEYRKWILDFCSIFHINCVDFHSDFENEIKAVYSDYLIDGLHPTKEGHRILSNIAFKQIKELGIIINV